MSSATRNLDLMRTVAIRLGPLRDRGPQPPERIAGRILVLRGHRVLVDTDLSALYGVKTKRVNEQVKRNADRFPSTKFVFQLTAAEKAEVVAHCDHLPLPDHVVMSDAGPVMHCGGMDGA